MSAVNEHRQKEADLLVVVKGSKMEVGMRALTAVLEARLVKCDKALRMCAPGDFLALQARAYIYEQLIREINT